MFLLKLYINLCHFVQICRLRSELDIVRGNTKVMSEMLTEMVPGQEDASDYELLQASKCIVPVSFLCVCIWKRS